MLKCSRSVSRCESRLRARLRKPPRHATKNAHGRCMTDVQKGHDAHLVRVHRSTPRKHANGGRATGMDAFRCVEVLPSRGSLSTSEFPVWRNVVRRVMKTLGVRSPYQQVTALRYSDNREGGQVLVWLRRNVLAIGECDPWTPSGQAQSKCVANTHRGRDGYL
jgi:hypothetical protein